MMVYEIGQRSTPYSTNGYASPQATAALRVEMVLNGVRAIPPTATIPGCYFQGVLGQTYPVTVAVTNSGGVIATAVHVIPDPAVGQIFAIGDLAPGQTKEVSYSVVANAAHWVMASAEAQNVPIDAVVPRRIWLNLPPLQPVLPDGTRLPACPPAGGNGGGGGGTAWLPLLLLGGAALAVLVLPAVMGGEQGRRTQRGQRQARSS